MPDTADSQEAVEVETDGVTVRKTLVTEEFPVPTVRFELESARDIAVTVRLREYVPNEFSMDAIGFHPDYESDNWTAYQDRRIEFVRDLEPDETAVTIYGIRSEDDADLAAFMVEPEIVDVEAKDAGEAVEEIVDPGRDQALRESIAPDEPTEADADVPAEVPTPEEAPAAEEPSEPAPASTGSVAARLAEELREDTIDDDDRAFIREELGLDISASTEAQLRHLQTRVEDVLGYANDLADLIDQGGAQRLNDIEDDLDVLRESVTSHTDDVNRVRDEVADVRATVEEVKTDVGNLAETTATASTDAADAKATVDEIADDIESLDTRLEGVQRSLDELDAAVDEVVTWRNQLGQLFGGQGEGPE